MMMQFLRKDIDIISAFAYKELIERIRMNPIGFLGVLAEPFIVVAGFMAVRLLFGFKGIDGMDALLFLGSGCMLFFLFKRVALGALGGVSRRDRSLLTLRRVKPIDLVLGRGLVEVQIYSSCMLLLVVGLSFVRWQPLADNPGAAILVFLMAAGTALGISITAFVVGHRLPPVKFLARLVISRVLFWTSGLFFSAALLPDNVRSLLLWNPLLHAIELFRHYLQPRYPIPGISVGYLAAWTFGSLGLSLLLYENNEDILLENQGDEP